MTNQEAIERIKDHIDIHKINEKSAVYIYEALDMAISALQAQDVPDMNVGDMVSRKAAIEAVEKELQVDGAYGYMDTKSIIDLLNDLPSAQPDIIRCKDCAYGVQDEYGRWYCRSLGCQIGDEDGNGFCSDAERRTDNANVDT